MPLPDGGAQSSSALRHRRRPCRPRAIVGILPGSPDARKRWNGSIINEIKSGANGSIAAEEVARAAPDGYTWLLVTTFFSTSPSPYNNLRWDPQRDFIPVGQICRAPNFFVVPSSLPVKSVAEYVPLAKAKPGTLNYSHPASDLR